MICRAFSVVFLAVSLLSGCGGGYDKSPFAIAQMQPQSAELYMAGKTIRTYSADTSVYVPGGVPIFVKGHGTQVEYFAPNGRAYLWYQGNQRPVPSLWKVERDTENSSANSLCFKYPTRSYNPLTGERGGRWSCRSLLVFANRVVESADGDIFNLSSMKLPFVMSKQEYDFNQLLKISDLPPLPVKPNNP